MKSKTVKLYFTLTALYTAGTAMIGSIYTNYLRAAGLNEFEVNMVNMAFFITITICEIPTGLFADIFGRKRSFVISCFLMAISMFVYALSHTMIWFMIAESLGGIAVTFSSGAFDAWMIDSLAYEKNTTDIHRIFSVRQKVSLCVTMLSVVIGGYIADISMSYTWAIGGIPYLICGVFASITMKEHYFQKRKFSFLEGLTQMGVTAKKSVTEIHRNAPFRFIILVGIIQTFAVITPNMEWQKVFGEYLEHNRNFGFFIFISYLAVFVGGHYSEWLIRKTGNPKVAIIIGQMIIGTFIMLTVSTKMFPLVVVYFLIHEAGRGLYRPLKEAFMQKNIPSEQRATLASFESVTGHIGGMVGLLMTGVVATTIGVSFAWVISGGILVIATLLVAKNGHKKV
ncbi:MAG: MFS transporter [Candidatus Paceibacterota bacterium]|jgi:MFS family permease